MQQSRLYTLIKLGAMKVRADFIGDDTGAQWVEYDPDKHGYHLLGNASYTGSEDDEDEDEDEDSEDCKGCKGIAPFIYRDDKGRLIPLKEIFMINPTCYLHDDSSFRVRHDTGTRDGNDHFDVERGVDKSDIPNIPTFWTDDGLDLIGSNDGYDNIHDIQ
jgi:hypothetical protein